MDMRTGGYAVHQQALGPEAAGAVRQAASLARRQGHAQVTPLHVASAMLAAPGGGLLRAACLRSHSDPLQHEALELCLSVALSLLPVSWPRPAAAMSCHGHQLGGGGHHAPAALSNALVAALKRAQAHKRRGSVEGLHQGLRQTPAAAAVKVELEQLIVSILDDPSVDRAMREAGFSSSLVKANVENSAALLDQYLINRDDYTTSPNPVYKKARAGTPSPETVREVLHRPVVVLDGSLALSLSCHSEGQAAQSKSTTWWPAFFGSNEVVKEKASLPSWLRPREDPGLAIPTRSNSTSLQATCRQPKFTDLTMENMKIMCNALELRVPWQNNIIPRIASTVLWCRSGMMRRTRRSMSSTTWLLFRGKDGRGKKAMAQELAKLIFGSYTEFTLLNSSSFSSGQLALKRKRPQDNNNGYVRTRLFEAILENPHRVIWIDGIDQLDHESEIAIKNAIAKGRIMGCNCGVVSLEDAILVLSSEVFDSRSSASFPQVNQRIDKQNCEGGSMEKEVRSRCFSLDLNVCTESEEDEEDNSIDDTGILNAVDGVFFFD